MKINEKKIKKNIVVDSSNTKYLHMIAVADADPLIAITTPLDLIDLSAGRVRQNGRVDARLIRLDLPN